MNARPAMAIAATLLLGDSAYLRAADVVVLRLDGAEARGPLAAIENDQWRLGGSRHATISAADLLSVEFPDCKPVAAPRALHVQLINGDRIAAGLTSLKEESLVSLWKAFPNWPPISIPVETIAGFAGELSERPTERSAMMASVFQRRTSTDVVRLSNGDRLEGELRAFDQGTLELLQGGKPVKVAMSRVRGVSFNVQLSSMPPPRKPRVIVSLADGSRLTGSQLALQAEGKLRLIAAMGAAVELPVNAVRSVRFLDGRIAELGDLTPRRVAVTPWLGSPATDFGRNLNEEGGALIVAGREYARGLGTRSRSVIEFQLDPHDRRFFTRAGLDDSSGGGDVRFAVDVDGRRLFQSEAVRGGDPAIRVGPLDVSGGKLLTLTVEYGGRADIQDRADWCDAVLIR